MGRRKRINYGTSTKGKLVEVESKEQMRAKFPPDLVSAFIKICEANWEDDKLYEKYKELELDYIGKDKAKDPIEQGKLIVQLSTATMDIVKKKSEVLKCKKHPTYRAIRAPRKNCKECWAMYNAKKKTQKQENKTEKTS